MGASKAIAMGIGRVGRNWRLLALFYSINLILAAVLSLPFATVFVKDVSRSAVSSELLGGFSYRWYAEFISVNGKYFDSLLPQVMALFALYIILEVFLAGGFYTAFSLSKISKTSAFFQSSSSKFFPILFVTVAELLLLFFLYEGSAFVAEVNREASRTAISDYQIFRPELWRYGLTAVLFFVINLTADFARAAISIDDDTFLSKIRRGVLFVIRHPVSTASAYLGAALIGTSAAALSYYFGWHMNYTTEEGVMVEIAAAQIFILFRIFSKLIFYAGEAALYKENQIEVINVKREMLE